MAQLRDVQQELAYAVARWKLSEAKGSSSVVDDLYGNNLNAVGSPLLGLAGLGKRDPDGSAQGSLSSYFQTTLPAFLLGNGLTVEAVTAAEPNGNSFWVAQNPWQFGLQVAGKSVNFSVWTPAGQNTQSASSVLAGWPQLVQGVYDPIAQTQAVWVDGTRVAVRTLTGAVPSTLTNLITNPSLESNATTGYGTATSFRITTGATLSVVTSQAFSGTHSMQVVTTAVANEGADYTGIAVTARQPITFSAYARGNAGGEQVQLLAGDGTVGSASSSTATLTNSGWTRLSVTLTPTASGTTGFAIRNPNATAVTFFADALMLNAIGGPVLPYFDGDTIPGGGWSGTPEASASTMNYAQMSLLQGVSGVVQAAAQDVCVYGGPLSANRIAQHLAAFRQVPVDVGHVLQYSGIGVGL